MGSPWIPGLEMGRPGQAWPRLLVFQGRWALQVSVVTVFRRSTQNNTLTDVGPSTLKSAQICNNFDKSYKSDQNLFKSYVLGPTTLQGNVG